MAISTRYPKLRTVDARPFVQNGRPYVLLRDPLQLTDRTLLIPQPLASVLAFCDGQRDVDGMSAMFAAYTGLLIPTEAVRYLLSALDDVLLLDNSRFAHAHAQALADYRRAPFRPPILTGHSYPTEASDLKQLLQGYIDATDARSPLLETHDVRGLISPHIDYHRGGLVYAHVWQQVARSVKAADLVVILGTDHYGNGDLLTLTRQHYATPYGILPTDGEVVDALAGAIGEETAFAGELRHRGEHSVELVAVWFHHMLGGQPCPMVPILTGSFSRFIQGGGEPEEDPTLQRFLDAFGDVTAGRRVVIAASGDLAHVGPAFGGDPLDIPGRVQLRASDDELIGRMCAGDARGLFTAIKQVQDRNNICGTAPIYLTMRLLGSVTGERVAYQHCAADGNNTSVVSVCGVIFR